MKVIQKVANTSSAGVQARIDSAQWLGGNRDGLARSAGETGFTPLRTGSVEERIEDLGYCTTGSLDSYELARVVALVNASPEGEGVIENSTARRTIAFRWWTE